MICIFPMDLCFLVPQRLKKQKTCKHKKKKLDILFIQFFNYKILKYKTFNY